MRTTEKSSQTLNNNTKVKYLYREIVKLMDDIDNLKKSWLKEPPITPKEIKMGIDASSQASRHPSTVPMTPIMKNMLLTFGDIARVTNDKGEEETEKLPTDAPVTKAEKWLFDTIETLLLMQSGKKLDSYNVHLPLRDIQHYYVDCWNNFNPEKFRDVGPGQVEEIEQVIKDYGKPTEAINIRSMMVNDPVFGKAAEVVIDNIPTVSATRQIREINLPFMTKHTNVGYIPGKGGFMNDRTMVPDTNMTAAQYTMKIAESLKDKPEELYKYNVSTQYARYQRRKGRFICAVARIVNLVLNQLEAVEIENYKIKSSLFAGYNDSEYLKNVLIQMLKFCEANGYVAYNLDYHRYDLHVVEQLIDFIGAVSIYKCADERSKKLALYRCVLMCQTWLVSGLFDKIQHLFGRIFSGFIDTNRGGGLINAVSMTYLIMKQNTHYVRDIVARTFYWMLVMGDDNCVIVDPNHFSLEQLQKDAKQCLGHEIDDPNKIAFGLIFLQYRLFEYQGKLVTAYSWTRVLRSALMKERSSGLGPCGWTLAFYQQCGKLVEVPEFLAPVVNILAYFDKDHLMLDKTIQEIIDGTKAEDVEAQKNSKRFKSTAEALYDGDPSKAQQFKDQGSALEPGYFERVQSVMKSVYDPDYFKKHGIAVPKLKA